MFSVVVTLYLCVWGKNIKIGRLRKVLMIKFGPKGDEVRGDRRKLLDESCLIRRDSTEI
jgi:hypothetical protein